MADSVSTLDYQSQPVGVGIHPNRLFRGSCFALISTAVAFGVVTSFVGQLKAAFALDNVQVGWIGGAALWGFTISIFILGPLCDVLGMRFLMRFALLCHTLGTLVMVFANGFTMLFIGALIISLGNGTVEAACNPLVATLFPTKKTEKLNRFHVWFPGGIVIGGLIAFGIDKVLPSGSLLGLATWQLKLLVILIPTLIYAVMFIGQKFPQTERVQSGVSFGGMVKETFTRPLFIVLFFCMMITASLELGPGRWMGEAMKGAMSFAGDNAGILVLVYGSVLMAVLRFYAGAIVHKLSNPGVLVVSAILGGSGLFLLTYAQEPAMVILAATIFYVGVCYFWPTMLGTAAERIPKGGALALALLGGTGMAVVGLVTVPLMGWIADNYVRSDLPMERTKTVLVDIASSNATGLLKTPEETSKDMQEAIDAAQKAIAAKGEMSRDDAIKALRAAIKAAPESAAGKDAAAIISHADELGSKMSFRWISASSIVLMICFGTLYMRDKATGFKPAPIGHEEQEAGSQA